MLNQFGEIIFSLSPDPEPSHAEIRTRMVNAKPKCKKYTTAEVNFCNTKPHTAHKAPHLEPCSIAITNKTIIVITISSILQQNSNKTTNLQHEMRQRILKQQLRSLDSHRALALALALEAASAIHRLLGKNASVGDCDLSLCVD